MQYYGSASIETPWVRHSVLYRAYSSLKGCVNLAPVAGGGQTRESCNSVLRILLRLDSHLRKNSRNIAQYIYDLVKCMFPHRTLFSDRLSISNGRMLSNCRAKNLASRAGMSLLLCRRPPGPGSDNRVGSLLSLERDDWKDEARRKARQRLISCFQADFYLQVYLTPLCSPSKERSCGDCQVRIT